MRYSTMLLRPESNKLRKMLLQDFLPIKKLVSLEKEQSLEGHNL